MDGFIDLLCSAVDFIIDLLVEIIEGICTFIDSVYNYFQQLPQEVKEMVKFIIDLFSEDGQLVLRTNPELIAKLEKSNVIKVDKYGNIIKQKEEAILEAVHDENENLLKFGKVIAADQLDDNIKALTQDDGLAVIEIE